jgi:hypothetical protein
MSNTQKFIIIKDRVEIYKDFAINLLYYIYNFYIDKETLSADDDIRNHYNWCFKKVCDEFKLEGLDFNDNNELKEYFYAYYYHQFYKVKNSCSLEYYEKFWKNIFEIDKQKNKNIINILIEIYNIYDKSINREKNILEIV